MATTLPTNTPLNSGIKTWRDFRFNNLAASALKSTKLFILPSKVLASPTNLQDAGELAYDAVTEQVIFSNGTVFVPLGNTSSISSISEGPGITLTPNPITGTGTVAVSNSGVVPGSYTYATVTVNAEGQITAASSGAVPGPEIPPRRRRGPSRSPARHSKQSGRRGRP